MELSKELKQELIIYKKMKTDPFLFIKLMWGLVPQKKGEPFIKGRHISWQQAEMFESLRLAINGLDKRKISIRSGKGIGKTAFLSMATLWFLTCYRDSIITCTGPVSKQLQDGIWKEISVWIDKMPEGYKNKYVKTSEYLRVLDKNGKTSDTWYARVVTGTKENPAAVSGVHSDNALVIIDEAPGVEDIVMDAIQSMMTAENAILLMIGNPIRNSGYFYDSHNKLKDSFQTMTFSGEDSPNVNHEYIQEVIDQYGIDSDEYRFNVLGEFPKEEGTDDGGWIPLLQMNDLNLTSDAELKPFRMGIDPSGQGRDESKFVARDNFKARVIGSEKTSDPKSVAGIGLTLATQYDILGDGIYVDNFGVGANVAQELALSRVRVNALNVGGPARDKKRFKNIRAEAYWGLREWIKRGGMLVNNKAWEEELLKIKYRRDLDGRIQIMPKAEMKKRMGKSPDSCDALMLTFVDPDTDWNEEDDVISVSYGNML